ncbi:MAG: hypothetical protein AUJ41_01675 [Candidatus Pacebacteria bacterium CG1_02_43_31]|uniref:Plasmid pRiA4b Orf3-like domain-containing protein n=1 Tax=Candidatus Nomurabacteria bacterium CG22_combo_CG10-13_8_21_14_all_32_8 TaxID=1974732 RepID=A0A2H0CFI0_9BACT|nr:MAG: hypothetical protein AUJ41_01675 [Candidatus Pacebacteria bacterium CG1_02_43_31]PIP68687.1 MAG: hypothetical protein COW91_03465 [Candidatus Nomurabacteria bacterium CG22_combo_CG10-13_8_21_14_all_32_8]
MKLVQIKITNNRNRNNFKIIEVSEYMVLYKFAELIVKSFGFYFDHCFGFYDNLDNPNKSTKMFELFTDLEDVEHTPNAMGVKKFYFVSDLFEKNKTMLFLFDYGESWHFTLELMNKSKKVHKIPKNYYVIYESHGQDPEQYPPLDE